MSKKPFDNSRITLRQPCGLCWRIYLDGKFIGMYQWQWTGIHAAKRVAKRKDKGYKYE